MHLGKSLSVKHCGALCVSAEQKDTTEFYKGSSSRTFISYQPNN